MVREYENTLEELEKRNIIDIEHIENAVWYHNPTEYEYVRMSWHWGGRINRKHLRKKGVKVIGFIKPIYKNGECIMFWLKQVDMGMPKEKQGYGQLRKRYGKEFKPTSTIKIIRRKK